MAGAGIKGNPHAQSLRKYAMQYANKLRYFLCSHRYRRTA